MILKRVSRVHVLVTSMKGFLIFTFFLLFVIILIVFLSYNPFKAQSKGNEDETFYLYQEINFRTNETSNGIVNLKEKILQDEYLSYRLARSGSSVVISNFESTRYRCSGSCFCEDVQRRYSNVLTRTISLLISAFSASVALKIASNSFQDQCASMLPACDESHIQYEVTACEEIEIEELPLKNDEVEYTCIGHCVDRIIKESSSRRRNERKSLIEYKRRNGKCENLRTSGIIRIKRSKVKGCPLHKLPAGERGVQMKRFRHLNCEAHREFAKSLSRFCKEMSQAEVWRTNTRRYKDNDRKKYSTNMCSGNRSPQLKKTGEVGKKYKNIRCVMKIGNKLYKEPLIDMDWIDESEEE